MYNVFLYNHFNLQQYKFVSCTTHISVGCQCKTFHAQYFLVNLLYSLFYLNLHHLLPDNGHPNKHKVYRVSIHTTLKKKYETLSIHTFCSTKYVFKAFVTFLQMFNYILHQRLVYIPKHI